MLLLMTQHDNMGAYMVAHHHHRHHHHHHHHHHLTSASGPKTCIGAITTTVTITTITTITTTDTIEISWLVPLWLIESVAFAARAARRRLLEDEEVALAVALFALPPENSHYVAHRHQLSDAVARAHRFLSRHTLPNHLQSQSVPVMMLSVN